MFVTVCLAKPRPSLDGGVGTAIVVTLGLCVLVWIVWMLGEHWPPLLVAGLIGMGAAGGVLAGLSPNSPAVAIGCMATLSAAVHLRTDASLGITAETVAAFLVTGLVARDIHDVLAHSLAAVSVNLQAAEGLLAAESLPAGNPELAKAIECIGRAAALTREGLAAARRAVLALRDDTAPLPDQLAALAPAVPRRR